MRHARLLILAAALAPALAGAAPRQNAPSPPPARPDLYAGYSHTRAGSAGLDGWGLAGSMPFRGDLSFVVDLSGHYGSFAGADLGQLAFMAGARWSWRPVFAGLRPFAEGLVGGARTSTHVKVADGTLSEADVDWGVALGGGLDYRLGARWSVRGLFHLRLLRGEGATDTDPRFSVGAAYRFGR